VTATTPIAETRRLRLREFGHDDLDELAAMVADRDQMTFYPRPKTRAEAAAWISRNLALYEQYGFGFWLLESLLTSEFVGYCGIRPLTFDGALETEIGWHTKKTMCERGPGRRIQPLRLVSARSDHPPEPHRVASRRRARRNAHRARHRARRLLGAALLNPHLPAVVPDRLGVSVHPDGVMMTYPAVDLSTVGCHWLRERKPSGT
jgi:RimJ/RimL family protein N-acetyltransferase